MELLTVSEVAKQLKMSRLSVIRLTREGHLRFVEVSTTGIRKSRRFRPEAVEAFIASREMTGKEA